MMSQALHKDYDFNFNNQFFLRYFSSNIITFHIYNKTPKFKAK